ncbi:MAG TPA: M6 family metalloprotease domain-containing protein [Candidatus Eisenbacteria bacterium]
MKREPSGRGWVEGAVVALAAAMGFAAAVPALAVSVSPRLLEEARRSPEAMAALKSRIDRYEATKALGVDKIYRQFSLDMAKYPRGGVAHRNILVVLAQFPQEGSAPALVPSKTSTPYYYWRLLFSDDPNDGIISLREYYEINSHGRLVISGQVTSKWLTMPHSYRYYTNGTSGLGFGAYPRSAQGLAEDAMRAAYGEFDGKLGYFDNDGPDGVPASGDDDGYVDATLVIHPGRGAELVEDNPPFSSPDDSLWSHEAGLAVYTGCDGLNSGPGCLPGIQLGDVKGFLYVLLGEYNEFPGDRANGTYCHEFGHTLGLPDLYDPAAGGLGFFSLMGLGNYLPYEVGKVLGSRPGNLDPWCRQYLGFDTPDVVTAPGRYAIAPVTEGGGSLRVWSNGEPGTEYFLLEARKREGPDQYLPADGLLIYHVNDTERDNLGGPPFYRVSLVQADSLNPLQLESPSGNYGDDRDSFPGSLLKRSWTESTQPNSRDFAGNDTGIRVWNIAGGSIDAADSATFDLAISRQPELRVRGVSIQDGGDGYADASETDSLTVTLANVGVASGPLDLTLSTADGAVTLTQGNATAPAIAGGASGTNAAPFIVAIGSIATLPHDIPFTLAWNDGVSSGSTSFVLTVGMGSGLAEDFELGALAWTHAAVAPSTSDEWHLSASRSHGGTTSMKVGSVNALGSGTNEQQTYAKLEDDALVSPAFDLPANSELSFWSYVDAETDGGTGAWDGGRVEISMNGGEWTPLAVDGGYGYIMEFNSDASLRGSDVFSGSPQRWRRVVADLSPYAGAARIRFRFATDGADFPLDQNSAQLRYYEGWYVDDVTVEGRSATGPAPRRLRFRAGPNPYWAGSASAGSITFRFSAPDGLPHPGMAPTVRIFDVRGRQIGSVVATANPLVPSEFNASWDARTPSGGGARSGIYFAKIDILGHSESVRLVLLR